MIKKYDEFINEELDWSKLPKYIGDIKKQVIKALDPFNGNINEMKKVIKGLLKNGVLPLIIISCLGYYFSEPESKSLLKEVMAEYDDGYGIINREISSAKSIVFNKINNYKNRDRIIKKLNEIEIRVGNLNEYNSLAQFVYNTETKEVCILVDEEHILTSDKNKIIESVAHEMLHYVDYLIGTWSVKNIEIINNSIDIKVKSDKKYATDKLFKIVYNDDYNDLCDSIKSDNKITSKAGQIVKREKLEKLEKIHNEIELSLLDDILDHYEYYTSPEEMFVRFNLLRNFMKSKGIIKDFNEKLTPEHFKMAIDKLDRKDDKLKSIMEDYLIILFLIDFDSESVNRIVKSDIKTNTNLA